MTVARRVRFLRELGDRGAPGLGVMAAAGLASLAVSACGASSHTATRITVPGPATTATSGPAASVTKGSLHATLVGESHKPVASKNWTYTVTAADAKGHPLSGTVETEFAFQGAVVGKESPPIHKLKQGQLKIAIQFPAEAVGNPIDLQVVVRTPAGSATLRWPVTVQK